MTATISKTILSFPNPPEETEPIIGAEGGLRQAWNAVRMVAPTDAAVLIQGETGTGKELIAGAIHNQVNAGTAPT
jgi:two-component system, NtrC family, response regulator HydG